MASTTLTAILVGQSAPIEGRLTLSHSIELESTWQSKEALRSEWIQFLERFKYNVWGTLTFRDRAKSTELALARASRVLIQWHKSLKRAPCMFLIAESHKLGGYHVHCLMRLESLDASHQEMLLTSLWELVHATYGRCQFDAIKDTNAVRGYVSKYLLKRAHADYRIIGK